MKTITTIILISFSFFVSGQTIKPNSYWIAVESNQIGEYGISPLDGMILKFKEKSVEFEHVFFDSIQSVPMKIRKNRISLEKKLWARIYHIDKDSLLLDFDKRMRVKFVPLETHKKTMTNIDFWNYIDWTFNRNDYCEEIKLTDHLWDMYPNEIAKNCLVFSEWEDKPYARNEKWNVKVVNDNHIFVKTFGQFDYEIYKVLKYSGDSVVLKNLIDKNESLMVKTSSISDSDYNSIFKKIKNYKWKTIELVNKRQAFEGDSAFSKYNSGGTFLPDTSLIKMSSLKNQQISLLFDDAEYKYFVSDTLYNSGKWKLSKSGKEIILNEGCIQEDYIDLLNVGQDTLTIGKFDMIQFSDIKRRYVDFYYVLKLIK
ncbi:hypothetical protein [Draconibacterium halophilum]|uniref:Uncharacterized protein n=1 Tax=Draconibacterium halophilum TaxID=2706887 RepID=A0A6C0RE53_9BACT|nr:hypothetical protein [Draconibacterium halophilum]QIA08834.1 hypothetical protein G0Q07_14390 [Draconibacterium halophilum]